MNVLIFQKRESIKNFLYKLFIRYKYNHTVLTLNHLDNHKTISMLYDWADYIISDLEHEYDNKLLNYSILQDIKNQVVELQTINLDNIFNQPCPFEALKEYIFESNKEFFHIENIQNFHLAHTHRIIYQFCKAFPTFKYAEIGSHAGNSALSVAFASPNLEIYCFDNPNSGWGGTPNTDKQLQLNLSKIPNKNFAYFGNSHSDKIKEKIKAHAPYDIFLVDGDHWGDGAYKDLELAYSVIKNDRVIIFDDLVHHSYLEETFDRFVEHYKPTKSIKILKLNKDEIYNKYDLRGVGIIIK
jgi:predicted O-methyltransferase YrrM